MVRPFTALCFKEKIQNPEIVTLSPKGQRSEAKEEKVKKRREADPTARPKGKEKMKDETKEPERPRNAGSQHALGWTHKSHEYEVYMKSACVHPMVKKGSRHLGPKGP